ncbi:MAG: hypothetical protein HQK54_16070, partial [Oligoflexales bacterium]|nr:hypothetical protein [Oligoflexales bacterium]
MSSLKQSHYTAFRKNNEFLNLITLFFSKSLDEIKDSITDSTEQLLNTSSEMMKISEARRDMAQQMILDTHLKPDSDVEKKIKSNQADVD